jgi:hypothetical protein
MSEDAPIRCEYELLESLLALELQVVETKRTEFHGTVHMKMLLREDPEILASCAFALIYGIGVLSFADARPRGVSGMHFQDDDQWYVGDMLRDLKFERGELHFHADYVRGRMMKTTVYVRQDGTVELETINRGESAARWVATLQGKKRLSVVDGAGHAES